MVGLAGRVATGSADLLPARVKLVRDSVDLARSAPRAPIDGSGSGSGFSCASRRIHSVRYTTMADYLPGPDADYQASASQTRPVGLQFR